MIMLDQTVVSVALPAMSDEPPLSPTGQQWVISAGGALMMPASAAIVVSAFPVSARGRAMAVYAGISQVFLAVGPLIGGVLTGTVSWRVVFYLNVPVGIAALVLVHLAKPDNVRTRDAVIDLRSVVLLVTGMAATVLAVQQASRWGRTAPATLLCLTGGLALTAVFVLIQLRMRRPLVDVRLFTRPAFSVNTGPACARRCSRGSGSPPPGSPRGPLRCRSWTTRCRCPR